MELLGLAKQVIVVSLLLLIVVGFGVAPATRAKQDPASTISPIKADVQKDDWKTMSNFKKELDAKVQPKYTPLTIVSSPTILANIENPTQTLYVASGVEKKYTDSEIQALVDFYHRGGKLIIADDFGFAQDLSSDDSFQVNYYQQDLLDKNFDTNISFIRVYGHLATDDNYLLELDKPTALHVNIEILNNTKPKPGRPHAEVLVSSSRDSYVDRNGDKQIGITDTPGPFPVVVLVQPWVGPGQVQKNLGMVVFVSDPGLFLNEMWDKGGGTQTENPEFIGRGNKEFVVKLVTNKLLPDGGVVLFDESRHVQKAYAEAVYGTLRTVSIMTSDFMEIALLITGMVIILSIVVWKAKDKEDWIHRFDIGTIRRRGELPESTGVIKERLRIAALKKVRLINSMGAEEVQALTPPQIANLIKDQYLNELVLNPMREFSPQELAQLTDRLRRWDK